MMSGYLFIERRRSQQAIEHGLHFALLGGEAAAIFLDRRLRHVF